MFNLYYIPIEIATQAKKRFGLQSWTPRALYIEVWPNGIRSFTAGWYDNAVREGRAGNGNLGHDPRAASESELWMLAQVRGG